MLPVAPSRAVRARLDRSGAALRGILWGIAAGLIFSVLNALLRKLAIELAPFQTQFLRYLFGFLAIMPFVMASGGIRAFKPNGFGGQVARGLVHTAGLLMWFAALPHVPLAEMTAIGFTVPIFVMIGAGMFLGERMVGARWVAAAIGFAGVLIVLAPDLAGGGSIWSTVVLLSSPLFAASHLITKVLTRRDTVSVIVVWHAGMVGVLTLPFALANWVPLTPLQWALFAVCGLLGSAGHYCTGRSLKVTEASATQSVKFLELVWAALLGLLMFGDWPSQFAIIGGLVIVAATLWIGRREARR